MSTFRFATIVFMLLYGFTFLFFLPLVCKDWAFSPLFAGEDKLMQYVKAAMALNDKRYYEAQLYLAEQDLNTENHQKIAAGLDMHKDVDIVIGIVTSNREPKKGQKFNLGYLTQTIASIHREVQLDSHFGKKLIVICNVDDDPKGFAEVKYLQDFAVLYNKYKDHETNLKVFERDDLDSFEKQKDDFVYCFHKALSYNPKYILILEDDVTVNKNFFKDLNYQLRTNIPYLKDRYFGESSEWAFLKLYYPEKWKGYSNDIDTILELFGMFLIGGIVTMIILNLCTKRITGRCVQRKWSNKFLLYCFCIGGLYLLFLCYFIGRVYVKKNLYSWHPLSKIKSPAPGCCTQATLYKASIMEQLTDYLENQRCNIDYSHDLAIDDFARINNYETFLTEPNMVKHIGMVSSVRAWAKNVAEYIF